MVEETVGDYVNYLRKIDFSKEIGPICANIDEILARMEEFELSISIIKNISTSTPIPNIIECKNEIQKYSDKINKLQLLLEHINTDVNALEQNVTKAEAELGYNNIGIKGFFKQGIFGKIAKNDWNRAEGASSTEHTYNPIESFKASTYFGEISSSDFPEAEDK